MRSVLHRRRATSPDTDLLEEARRGWCTPVVLPAVLGTARACCCPARPWYQVLVPPTAGGTAAEEILLCGHHYVISEQALISVGAAVEYAFEEAALRGAAITAVHAWTDPVPSEPGDMLELVYDLAEVEADETRLPAEALAGLQET
jgi:hypothetical protein